MVDTVSIVRDYLSKMGLKYVYDDEEKAFITRFHIDTSKGVVDAFIIVKVTDNWVIIFSPLMSKKSIPRDVDRLKLYMRLLRDTFYLNEIVYCITEKGDIVTKSETHVKALSYDNFRVEFYALLAGIKHFVESIASKIKEEYKDVDFKYMYV